MFSVIRLTLTEKKKKNLGHNYITPLFLIHDQEIIEGLTKFRLSVSEDSPSWRPGSHV